MSEEHFDFITDICGRQAYVGDYVAYPTVAPGTSSATIVVGCILSITPYDEDRKVWDPVAEKHIVKTLHTFKVRIQPVRWSGRRTNQKVWDRQKKLWVNSDKLPSPVTIKNVRNLVKVRAPIG